MIPLLIDTREQKPWSFSPAIFSTRIDTLKTGDYAIEGDPFFAIERKSLDDFLGTIGSGWERFCREIARMEKAEFVAKVVIVEGSYISTTFGLTDQGEIIPPQHRHWFLSPQFVAKRIAQLTLQGVSVLFAHDSELASALAGSIFIERIQKLQNENRTN